MPRVHVVTDSTAYLPADARDKYDVEVVPLQVVVDGRVGAEGVDVGPAEVAGALTRRGARVSTSRPAPQAFLDVYTQLAAGGAEEVVSVHLSAELSGTVAAARLAAAEAPVAVHVVDSRSTAMGLGLPVLAAAEAAAAGAAATEVARTAQDVAGRCAVLFALDTLEFLRRGGRIGQAEALLGGVLAIKPILHILDGRIRPLEKVRTSARARTRLVDLAVATAGDGPVDVAVHHLAADGRAAQLATDLRERLPGLVSLHTSEVGAVIGAHCGPGLLGVVVCPR